MKSFIPAFEHGLLLCEIDEMLEKLPAEAVGVVEFRSTSYGEMQMLAGGVFETFRVSAYLSTIEEENLLSNKHKAPMLGRTKKELDRKDFDENLIDRIYLPKEPEPHNPEEDFH